MKALKLLLASLVCMVFFTNSKKPFSTATFYYVSGSDYQRMEYNHCSEPDIKERGIGCVGGGDFMDINNWTTTVQSYTTTPDMSKYIGCISFNLDDINPANGGSDGDLTLSEALDALYNEYVSGIGMPSSFTVGTTNIIVQAATAAH